MTAPEFHPTYAQVAEWAFQRVAFLENMKTPADMDPATAEQIVSQAKADAIMLTRVVLVMSRLAKVREVAAEHFDEPIDPALEWGASANLMTALACVVEAHTRARAFALLMFETHDNGRISLDVAANVPRAALHQSLGIFVEEKTFLRWRP